MTLLDIERYRGRWSGVFEEEIVDLFKSFLNYNLNAYERSNQEGHITASGFVLSVDRTALLMTYHAKLKKWLQLGGHADGHQITHEVAYRECEEESGLSSLSFFSGEPFILDLDRHLIPARKGEKEHFHYDVRYLLLANKEESLKITQESLDLKWVPLEEVTKYCKEEPSIMRCLSKIKILLDLPSGGRTQVSKSIQGDAS